MPVLRTADPNDLAVLPDIERAAGELFRPLGMDLIADDAPPTVETLRGFATPVEASAVPSSSTSPAGRSTAICRR